MFTFALSSGGQKGREERTLRMVETPATLLVVMF